MYCDVIQQMVLDVTGQPYPDVMRENVLAPLGMARSSYEQPLPRAMAAMTAAGHHANGAPVHGRWHVYPEMAAAGLWTTPSDLARFAIEVQRAYAGTSTKVISSGMAREMLTVQKGTYALGLGISDTGMATRFSHSGRDRGFDADMLATLHTGQGVVIMINANEDSRIASRIRMFVMRKYHWPNAPAPFAVPLRGNVAPAQVAALAGRYEPSADRDARVSRALRALAAGGSSLTGSTDITDGLRKVAAPALQDAKEIRSPSFAWLESVAGRDIQRLGSVVTSVGYYRVSGVSGNTRLLVYFDEKGLIADLDLVDE